ncbi:hypothetical protein HZB78_00240 [Candidatus Collierbacteria bacterium]|nr:hypothetical protein [Candidatus Collierbacteria bacterium]
MLKRIVGIGLTGLLLLLVSAGSASASEGTAFLTSNDNDAKCFLASVLVDVEEYQFVMTCRNLITPPDANRLFYQAWGRRKGVADDPKTKTGGLRFGKGAYFSLGDISTGKLNGRAREAFEEVLVTAEAESGAGQPTLSALVVSGAMQDINFGSASQSNLKFSPTSTIAKVTLVPTPKSVSAVPQRSVGETAARVFFTLLFIIVIVAVVISIIQRRSASR